MWSEVVHKLWASLPDCPRESCIADDHDRETFIAKANAGITRREVAAFDKAMIEQGEYMHLYKLVHEGYCQMAKFLQGPTVSRPRYWRSPAGRTDTGDWLLQGNG